MKKYLVIAAIIFFLSAEKTFADTDSQDGESMTVLASTSLSVPITEIVKKYSRANNVNVNVVFDASMDLMKSIHDGEAGDVIITPSKEDFDRLKAEGLLDPKYIRIIASNTLDIVAAKELSIKKQGSTADIFKSIYNRELMVTANPETTSLGRNSQMILENLGLWGIFEKRVILAPTAAKTVDLIIKGQSAGIVYASDAKLYHEKLDNLGAVPPEMYKEINYYAAIIIGGNMEKGRKFVSYLDSEQVKQIFKENGFMIK